MFSASTILPPPVPVDGDDAASVDPYAAGVSLQDMLWTRLPRVVVTPAILVAIVGVFVAMAATSGELFFSSQTLDRWGAQFGPAISAGEWWRLLTASWLHANPIHLAFNGLFLWRFGNYVERLLGPVVFLIVYLLAGVIASVVSLQFQTNGLSVGASGALFGLVGVLLMVAFTSRGRGDLGDMLAELRPNLVSVVLTNLMLGFMIPGIDNAAHLGGLAGGLGLGWLVGRHSLDAAPSPRTTLVPIIVTAGIAAAGIAAVAGRHEVGTEVARLGGRINAAEAAFRGALADVAATRRSAQDVANDVQRTVFPMLHDAQQRADTLVTATGSDAAARATRARGERPPADAYTTLSPETAWKLALAEYAYAWQLRVDGLRTRDAAKITDGNERAGAAIRTMSALSDR